MALGYTARATQRRAVAIGRYAEAIAQDAVALGADSQANGNMFDSTTRNAEFKDDAGLSKKIDFAAYKSLINGAVSVGKAVTNAKFIMWQQGVFHQLQRML